MPQANRLPETRTLLIAATIVAALFSFWTYDHGRRAAVERRASAAASLIAGRQVHVHCPGHMHRMFLKEIHEGSVRFNADGRPSDDTKLSGGACDGLRYAFDHGATMNLQCLAYHCPKELEQAAMGLVVLAPNDSRRQCRARTKIRGKRAG